MILDVLYLVFSEGFSPNVGEEAFDRGLCAESLRFVRLLTSRKDTAVTGPNGQTLQVARAGMVLGHALDLADHYSQVANYMRLNSMLPPSALPRPGRGGN